MLGLKYTHILAAFAITAMLGMASAAYAQGHPEAAPTVQESTSLTHPVNQGTRAPSAGAMAFDLILVRPLGLAATVLGTALFVVNLPLSVFEKNAPEQPFHRLVVEPLHYTFRRPLGQINNRS